MKGESSMPLSASIQQVIDLYESGQRQKALVLCERLLTQHPLHLELMGYRAALLRELNQTDAAVLAYQALAEAHAEQGDYLKALAMAREFDDMEPDASERTTRRLAQQFHETQGAEAGGVQTPAAPPRMNIDPTHTSLPSVGHSTPGSEEDLIQQLLEQLHADTESVEPELHGRPLVIGQGQDKEVDTTQLMPSLPPPEEDGATFYEDPATSELPPPLPPLFNYLDAESIAAVWRQMQALHLPAHQFLIQEGETGDSFYIIVDGTVRILRQIDGQLEEMGHLGPGQFFGEISLLTPLKRTATVETISECHILQLHRADLQRIIQQHPQIDDELRRFVYQRLIQNLVVTSFLFFPLSDIKRWELAQYFHMLNVPAYSPVCRQGQHADGFYIIAGGSLEMYQTASDGTKIYSEQLGSGQFFGATSLLYNIPSPMTIEPQEAVTLLRLDASQFHPVMQNYPRVFDLIKTVVERRYQKFFVTPS